MQKLILILAVPFLFISCASKTKIDGAMLEKYPVCYSKVVKLANKCIELNESGKTTTALQLENAAYPGQYE